ncbi:hypothetical protein H9L39_01976 [Fusarium oxysporum f. sp. albedinis]|nr:hypothetical protein H9L39_01976 [Fusarium oxysporum f. sp. albedinis]
MHVSFIPRHRKKSHGSSILSSWQASTALAPANYEPPKVTLWPVPTGKCPVLPVQSPTKLNHILISLGPLLSKI